MEALSDDQLVAQARKGDVDAHLDSCPSCQAFLDQITLIDEEVRSLVVPELFSPSSGEFLSENLTVYQQAKYLIFVQDFLKDLREKLNKARDAIKKEK
jgi:nitrite reductase/ring-hydroxylating ferredoxin subunit